MVQRKVLTRTDHGAGDIVGPDVDNANILAGDDHIEIDGYLKLNNIADPSPMALSGMLYVKLIDGYSDLHYMDEYGEDVRLTEDGYNYVKLTASNGSVWKLKVSPSGVLGTELIWQPIG